MPVHVETNIGDRVGHLPGRQKMRLGMLLPMLVALLVCMPLIAVVWLAFFPSENIWPHLFSTVLPDYVLNTFLLMAGVCIGTLLIGVSTAWVVTHYEFPGRKLMAWALLLPFAYPSYVIAYVYTDLFEYAGPVQTLLRDWFGWRNARDYYFPSIRSLGGAVIMMVLVLYPYVYLLARAAFLEQSASVLDAARILGSKRWARFFRIALPMARPAIAVGVAMALMETLNDYGTVDYFAVRTLTAGIYDVWLGMGNLGGGAQIACLLLLLVIVLVGLEKFSRKKQHHYQPVSSRLQHLQRIKTSRLSGSLLLIACVLPIIAGFVVPSTVLFIYAVENFSSSWTPQFRRIALSSISLSFVAAIVTVAVGILLSYSKRIYDSRRLHTWINVSSLGYAVPGPVLAIGVMIPLAAFDNRVDALMREWFGFSSGLLLSGTLFALVFAYTVRFLAVAFGSIDASMKKIGPSMDDAGRVLGKSRLQILTSIHLPLMRSGLLTASLVVFVDCMKELPATLVMRPFGFDTLATHVYQYASDELLAESALAALLIVLTGLIPVILLSRSIDISRSRRDTAE